MFRLVAILALGLAPLMTALAQVPAMPNLDAQRAAMKKLAFLAGKWSGEARLFRAGATIEVAQREEAQFKLGGLLLEIEGTGTRLSDGQPALQALGIVSYDDSTGAYRFRAFNDGRWLETELQLTGDKELTWGFVVGEYRTHSVLRLNEKGEWTESHQLIHGSDSPRKLMDITVRRQK